jgi:hypothetical protein
VSPACQRDQVDNRGRGKLRVVVAFLIASGLAGPMQAVLASINAARREDLVRLMTVVVVVSVLGMACSGCSVTGPQIKVGPPVEIKAAPAKGGTFCPPGQAKKGNC